MKIVIGDEYGGAPISFSAAVYAELGIEWDGFGFLNGEKMGLGLEAGAGGGGDESMAYRANPRLVAVVEKLGVRAAAEDGYSLKIVEIPDGVKWVVYDFDGREEVHEVHRSWG